MKRYVKHNGKVQHTTSDDEIITHCGLETERLYGAQKQDEWLPICKTCLKIYQRELMNIWAGC